MSLTGKVALITGASNGIGKAVALRLAADGASIVINYHTDGASATALVSRIGADRALAVQADVSQLDSITALVDAAVARFGKIDILMPNAGILLMRDLSSATPSDFDRTFSLNVRGPLFLAQAAAPHMAAGSRVVFVTTGLNTATTITPGYLLYAASKGAVHQMTRALAKDLGRRGITVNAVAPGPTATELFMEGKTEAVLRGMEAQSPFGRVGTPEEVADVVAFLAGEGSRWVSGQVVRVNGAFMV
ncbi:hypothetical protein B0T18DRAFT_486344 [Schizothecium vesticola]|uniref:NAD(P)-binding protein n=1 Tax=Schizothecium vesticola TaxID=314040 RepID=A0AA40F6R0_9PEZI|nr:hypothetical protein B0T18DRAFT_486344 [Schizothecium vesticola]